MILKKNSCKVILNKKNTWTNKLEEKDILLGILWKKCCKIVDDLQLGKLGHNFFQDLFSQCVSLSQKFLIL